MTSVPIENTSAAGSALYRVWADGAPTAEPRAFPLTDSGAIGLAQRLAFPKGRVWVRSMMNQSLDGSLTGDDGTSASLGNPTDFFALTVLRGLPDIIVAGAKTVRGEDYRRPSGKACVRELGLRPSGSQFPALAILTRSGNIPETVCPDWPTYLVTDAVSRERVRSDTGFPAEQIIVADGPRATIAALAERGYRGIQVEGGASVLGTFLAAGAIDELAWTRSALTVGGEYSRIAVGESHRTPWALHDMYVGPHATFSIYRGATA